ncbi:MAG TPA: hypothetical protein VFG01_03545 [Acidobacteriota bacterium]|nr:hypothetical protein [Acidobacteriota bacterium]
MDLTENDLMIGIFGCASGTYKGLTDRRESHYYRIPAFWKAVVKQGKTNTGRCAVKRKRLKK